jgi:hypothetical protein
MNDWHRGFPPELELLVRRRRQMLVHSYIYYRLDTQVVSDHQWQAWADELATLPLFCETPDIGFYDDAFSGWDGSTGYHLPSDPDIARVALRVREHAELLALFS